nr:unnamed protein product [Digitaria exilis]
MSADSPRPHTFPLAARLFGRDLPPPPSHLVNLNPTPTVTVSSLAATSPLFLTSDPFYQDQQTHSSANAMSTESSSTLSSSSSTLNGGTLSGSLSDSTGAIFIHPFATVTVKSHAPMTLELKGSNFTRWSAYFRTWEPNNLWAQADFCNSVLSMAMEGTTQSPCDLWVAINSLFQANKTPRAIFLSHEFHSMTQGDDYCLRMKTTPPTSSSTLVLNLLRGLNKVYSNTGDHIAATNLSFPYARDQLLKELRLANETKVAVTTALLARSAPSCGSSGCRSSSRGGQQHQHQPRRNNKKSTRSTPAVAARVPTEATRQPVPIGLWVCMSPGGQFWSGFPGRPQSEQIIPSKIRFHYTTVPMAAADDRTQNGTMVAPSRSQDPVSEIASHINAMRSTHLVMVGFDSIPEQWQEDPPQQQAQSILSLTRGV